MPEFSWANVILWLLEHGTRILIILLLGLVLWFLLKRFTRSVVCRFIVSTRGESKEGIEKRTTTLVHVFTGVEKIIIFILVIIMILTELGVPTAPVLASFGIAGIAVGFGAQYLIRDLIAGIFIIMENQYRVGDVAKLADIGGLVEEVNLRKTVLRDLDGVVHHIPNGEIRVASNMTRHWARANMNISVAYKEDLDRVMEIFKKIWEEMAEDPDWKDAILEKKLSFLRVEEFGDSGIVIKVAGVTKPIRQWDVMGEFRRRVKKTFDREGIEIPWPHTKVYFGNEMPSADK